jgi:hypothetical protein
MERSDVKRSAVIVICSIDKRRIFLKKLPNRSGVVLMSVP